MPLLPCLCVALLLTAAVSLAPESEGTRPVLIDEEGVYACEPSERFPMPPAYARDPEPGGKPVRCRIVDYVDCTQTGHDFQDDGKSRVLELAGRPYRVTGTADRVNWFSYVLKTNPTPGKPHLVLSELVNDIERYTTVTLTVPKGMPWAAPYTGEESFRAKSLEDDSYHPDVGGCVYTGREYPATNRPFPFPVLFYPKAGAMKVTVSRYNAELRKSEASGAAVSRIWMLEVLDDLPPAEPAYPVRGRQRQLGLYVPHAWYLYAHYGVPSRTEAQRRRSLAAFTGYLRFCGLNSLQFHLINGTDTAVAAWYPSQLYPMLQGDLTRELFPLTDRYGIRVVPIIAPIFVPVKQGAKLTGTPDEEGFSLLSLQLDRDGEKFAEGMNRRAPDPLRPEVQRWVFRCLDEIAEASKRHPSVGGVGLRVNGKIGLCYIGRDMYRCGQDSGYSEWDIRQFEEDTGVQVPRLKPTPYEWLKEHAWERWIDWRCRRIRDFWLRCRDRLRAANPRWDLWIATDLPSEWPGYNIEWVAGERPRDLLRHHGVDPMLFTQEKGILLQRAMMINSDRFFGSWGHPQGTNAWAHKSYSYGPGVMEMYRTAEGDAVELYHNYWEEVPHPDNEFGPVMRTANAVPVGDNLFEPAVASLLRANVHSITLMGWERASIGNEHRLRRWSRAFRALPYARPQPFGGEVSSTDSSAVRVSRYGDRVAAINNSAFPQEVSLVYPRPVPKGRRLVDAGSGVVMAPEGARRVRFSIPPWGLRVLAVVPEPEPPSGP